MKVFCAFVVISDINLFLMPGVAFKTLFQNSTRPDLQQCLCTFLKVQGRSSRIYRSLQGQHWRLAHLEAVFNEESIILPVCLPKETVMDSFETAFKPHHYNGKSHPSLLIPEAGMSCSKYYRTNGTNTSLLEQLELTEEHRSCLRLFLPGHWRR